MTWPIGRNPSHAIHFSSNPHRCIMIPWGTRQGGARVTGLIVSDQNDGEFGASVQVQTAHDRAHGPDLKIKPLSTSRFDCACLIRVRWVVIQGLIHP